jgi:perosamine synthetase
MVSKGKSCAQFEQEHANLLNKRYGIACGSGTQGLVAILKHLKIGEGDEVILPSYVCDKVEEGILAVGAIPVLCDIGESWVMNKEYIKAKLSPKTKAIILVHIFGINAFSESLKEFDIPIIEDICQSTGSWNHKFGAGSYTEYAFTSFHATKCLTTGQGGMAFCNDDQAEIALRQYIKQDFLNDYSDLQASLGLAQLAEYDFVLKQRQAISQRYLNELNPSLISKTRGLDSMYFRFPIISNVDFNWAKEEFEKAGISIRKGVDAIIHRKKGISDSEFPNTAQLFETTISLPILPQLTQEQIDHIIYNTNKILA